MFFQNVFRILSLQIGSLGKRRVEVIGVSLVMLVVVQMHGLRVDVRFQCFVCVGQCG